MASSSSSVSVESQIRDHIGKRIMDIASEAADCSDDTEIAAILIDLEALFSSHRSGPHADFIMQKIWESELIEPCIMCLACDYSRVNGSWPVGAQLAKFLQQYFQKYVPKLVDVVNVIRKELEPKLLNNCVLLSRRIQTRYEMLAISVSPQKQPLLASFKAVLDVIEKVVARNQELARSVLENAYLLKMLLTDEPDTLTTVLDTIMRLGQVCGKEEFSKVPEDKFYALLDEMVYKLSEFDSPTVVAAAVTRTLVAFTQVYPKTGDAFFTRYKGIRFIITRWTGKGFGQEQQKLLNFLDSQTRHMKEMERFHRAARVIQRVYRSFQARRHLARLKAEQKNQENSEEENNMKKDAERRRKLEENDLKLQLTIARHRGAREVKEKHLYLIEQVPAKQVDRFLQRTENQAALNIQALWRGYKLRKSFLHQRVLMRQVKSAITIQRWIRRCLAKVDQRRMLRGVKTFWSADGLSEERRAELQQSIQEFRERLSLRPMSKHEQEAHFQRAQDSLKHHIQLSRIRAKADVRRETLLAKMEIDCQLIREAPSLDDDLSDDVINRYLSPIAPIALSGKQAHLDTLQQEKLPWYKKLGVNTDIDIEDTFSTRSEIERQIDRIVKY